MGNLPRIMRFSRNFHRFTSALLVAIPVYYVIYWAFINVLPKTLVTINMSSTGLLKNSLPVELQLLGFAVSLLPLSALIYGLFNIRKLFSFYREGVIFTFAHVMIFRNTARALIGWTVLSILYESVKSVLFTMGNPPGQRVLSVTFGSPEMTTLVVAGIVFVIAWVMDEGRILSEEQKLTV